MTDPKKSGQHPGQDAARKLNSSTRNVTHEEHELEVERSLLGAMLLDDQTIQAAAGLTRADFRDQRNGLLFVVLQDMKSQGMPIDAVTVGQRLIERGNLDDAGGVEHIELLMQTVPHAANAGHYAKLLRDNSNRRQLRFAAVEIAQRCDNGEAAGEVLANVLPTLSKLNDLGTRQFVGIRAKVESFSQVTPKRLSWLWPGRIPLGMLTVVSGHPGIGKSFVTVDTAARVSSGRDFPDGRSGTEPEDVLLINFEDATSETQAPRLIAAGADLNRVHYIAAVEFFREGLIREESTFGLSHAVEVFRDALSKLAQPKLIVAAGDDFDRPRSESQTGR